MASDVSSRPDARSRVVAFLAAGLLVASCAARWTAFVYPNYLAWVLFQAGVLALTLIWAYPHWPAAGIRPGLPELLLLGYLVFSIVSSLWAPQGTLAAVAALHMLFTVTWALGLGSLLRNRRDLRIVLRAIFVAGTVAAIAAIAYVAVDIFRHGFRRENLDAVEHVQGHRNFLAMYLLPSLLLSVASLLGRKSANVAEPGQPLELPGWIVSAGALAMFLALLMCKSSGALIGLMAGLVCLSLAHATWRTRAAVLAGALILAFIAVGTLTLPVVKARLMESPQATRWFMWKGAIRMFLERPLAGWGTGMFALNFADYKPTEVMKQGWLTSITLYPHNEVLLVAVEGGLIALALYLGAHFVIARRLLCASEVSSHPGERALVWVIFAGLLAMFLHGLVEVSLRFWAPASLYWTLIGTMLAILRLDGTAPSNSVEPATRRAPRVVIFAATVVVVLLAALGVLWCGATAEWLMGAGVVAAKPTEERYLALHARAARLSRYVPDYLIALRRLADGLRQRADLDRAIAAYERIERTCPGYGPTRRILAALYMEKAKLLAHHDPDGRRRALRRAIELLNRAVAQNPYDSRVRMTFARALLMDSSGHLAAALEHARAAVESDPRSAEPRLLLAELLARDGRYSEGLAQLDAAAACCPPSEVGIARRISALRELIAKLQSGPK